MMELTTGAVFLLSSIYGAGSTNGQVAMANPTATDTQNGAVSQISSFTGKVNIEKYVREAYADEPILVDIARCESNFHQFDAEGNVVRGVVNKADVGVMQINEKFHADEAKKLGLNLYTLEGNVAFGKYLYDKYGAEPWKYSSKCWASTLAAK